MMNGSNTVSSQPTVREGTLSTESANIDGISPLPITQVRTTAANSVFPLPSCHVSTTNTPAKPECSTVVEDGLMGTDAAQALKGTKLKEVELEPEKFKELLASGNFSDDVHYKVKGDLWLGAGAASEIHSMPKNLSVNGWLCFHRCRHLPALPENLTVGHLSISFCNDLTALPENLKVAGHVRFVHCYYLAALPENFEVKGDLDLIDCTDLTALPEKKFYVGGNIDLSACMSLTSLPSWITELGPSVDEVGRHHVRDVVLADSGLSQTLIEELCRHLAPGMRLIDHTVLSY